MGCNNVTLLCKADNEAVASGQAAHCTVHRVIARKAGGEFLYLGHALTCIQLPQAGLGGSMNIVKQSTAPHSHLEQIRRIQRRTRELEREPYKHTFKIFICN